MAYQKIYGIPTRTMWLTPSDYALIPCPSDFIYQGKTTDDSGDPTVLYDSTVNFKVLGVTEGCVILIKKPSTGQGWAVARTINDVKKADTGNLGLNAIVSYPNYVTGKAVSTDYAIYRPPTKPCIVTPRTLRELGLGTYADKPITFRDAGGDSTDVYTGAGVQATWITGLSFIEGQGVSNIWPFQISQWVATSTDKGVATDWEALVNAGGVPDAAGCQLFMGSW
ncbi:MAG: hypothetical protein Unbinned1524contig1000_24 [Prokaryotic dsDNA virus sp.]|nr:MAG: hypothetical protein Unbinned1524contig1000_24 [Prokaryotic dsDNA virus sp.]|tara:strand:- start:7960 stop:8631 length:672 start_codon:yes stop_codon:yes gene_type:complete